MRIQELSGKIIFISDLFIYRYLELVYIRKGKIN